MALIPVAAPGEFELTSMVLEACCFAGFFFLVLRMC